MKISLSGWFEEPSGAQEADERLLKMLKKLRQSLETHIQAQAAETAELETEMRQLEILCVS